MKPFVRSILLVLFVSVAALSVKGQTASFTASITSGCAPLIVTFVNTTAACSGCTCTWDLDNGIMPVHTWDSCSTSYDTAGTYTITLTVVDGGVTTTHSVTILVYPSPTVHFIASETSVCPGEPITFTSTSIGGVPGPLSYTWAFGDGTSTTAGTPTKSYSTPGTYNVTLAVTNSEGCTSTLVDTGYIHVNPAATPGFTVSASSFCNPPATVTFTSTTTGTGPFTYVWRYGDGSSSPGGSPISHTYTSPGSYSVTLVVTDGDGCTDSITAPTSISIATLSGGFTYPDTACVNSSVSFTDTSAPHTSTTWEYGDGGTGYAVNGNHTYTSPGTYTVTMIISNGSCNDTVTHTIVIVPGPTASFVITPPQPCPPPAAITLTATTPPHSSVTWHYGDGYSGTGLSVIHNFGDTGIYSISMVTLDSLTGCKSTITKLDTFYNLLVTITPPDPSGCAPLTVSFGATAYTTVPTGMSAPYPFGIASWNWSFGDGGTGTGAAPVHTFTAPGNDTVVGTVTTDNGCTKTDTVIVKVGAPPVAAFVDTTNICYHDNDTSFTATLVSGVANEYTWIIRFPTVIIADSMDTAYHYDIIHYHFPKPGTYSIEVIPSYNGCPGPPVSLVNNVIVDSPMAILADSILCSPEKTVDFADLSLGDDSHLWVFGDGSTSTMSDPAHLYPATTTYSGYLATYNSRSGCRDTAYFSVNLHRPVVTFAPDDTAVCKYGIVHFTATVTGGSPVYYEWFSNGTLEETVDTSISPVVFTEEFDATGTFTVSVVIADQNGCHDTATGNNNEFVAAPVADFSATPLAGCVPLPTTYTDHSTDVPGATITGYRWLYGDGTVSTIATTTTSHTFTTSGSFTTKEIVTDNIGCKDTFSLSLTVYHPAASFTASNTHPCTDQGITFTNTTPGVATSYWNFGDGHTSTLTSPSHTYTAAGVYTVSLAVTDTHGCTDTLVDSNYMTVSKPDASFYMDDSVSICPPLTVHFINTSTGATSYSWTFGDGSSSLGFSPTDLYITTGYFPITLIVTNSYGCTDTAIGHVNIFGYAGAFTYNVDSGCVPLTVRFNALISNVPNIVWDFADGTTSALSYTDSISHTYLIPGAFVPKLILSDNTGCKSSNIGIDTIKVDAVTPGFTTIPDPICLGGSFNFSDTSKSYWSTITAWKWTFDSTTSILESPSFTVSGVGVYPVALVVTDGWGCTDSITGNVTVYAPPVITVSPDTIICTGGTATLTGYGGITYTWSPPATLSCTACNPTHASPTVVTQYTVTGTDAVGCSGTDTTTVLLKTKTVSIARGDTQVCAGITIPLLDSGGTKYQWIPGTGLSNPYIADPTATLFTTTTFMVIAQLATCMADTNYVTVIIHPLPTVYAGPDQTLLEGSSAQLNATGTLIEKYAWDNSLTLSCDNCPNPVASMTTTTTYNIQVTSEFGCTNSDSVTIHLYCDNSQVFIPNAFTPNGDGQDDVFYPRGRGINIIKSFRIYNRWGQLLFERTGIQINDIANAWDGSYNGGSPRPDVYVYIIDAECDLGQPIFIKGDVTIIR